MNLNQRRSGVLLHITSLPGPHGIGDFGPAAFKFVDWMASAGQTVWQTLPMMPIGPCDSPYMSVSAFAGSPLMVALEPLVEKGWLPQPALPEGGFDAARADYGRVVPWRLAQLRAAWAGFKSKASAHDKSALDAWAKREASWLDDYALLMALEGQYGAQGNYCWWQWPADLRARKPKALAAARAEHADEVGFWRFVQWCWDVQWAAIKAYANSKGISIMGDLPIFIAHHSADCWSRPDLYYLDEDYQPTVVAGVPPDGFAPDGQRWGNPLYRWDRMAAEDYAWWTQRIRRAMSQADVFRIDHFRGFAGYYEIPASCPTAREGQWVPGPGKALFAAIERALGKLPIVAEDLGLITEDVTELRDHFGFPGMKILQFGFGGDGTHEFMPQNYTPNCIVYTGTHDNDTARGWWDAAPHHERSFCGAYLACSEHDVHWAMIRAASNSVANMAIFPLQDVLGLGNAGRMNLPGSTEGNWQWRFTWEQLGAEPARVLGLISGGSGRAPFELVKRALGL
ncbi:4-alpha-glucanotransferase [Piscinibacterium candidicorallinum]|jgi:4-alpha-glucanotransferase|uniref:4-alpha-glucanotransferase n=1 Tax=Piscinibacterium candidicorallinum TaxID=1793872 RepID=A0ABV7H6E3_9BURK